MQQQRASADRKLPATIEGIADKIAPHPLSARLNRDAQFCIAQRCGILFYPAGTVLMRQDEIGSFACVVLEGEIDILVEIPAGPIPMATAGGNWRLGGGQKFGGGKTVCNTAPDRYRIKLRTSRNQKYREASWILCRRRYGSTHRRFGRTVACIVVGRLGE